MAFLPICLVWSADLTRFQTFWTDIDIFFSSVCLVNSAVLQGFWAYLFNSVEHYSSEPVCEKSILLYNLYLKLIVLYEYDSIFLNLMPDGTIT